ncbi:hypothetical protein [Flavobacterium collinsii]|nr:hypothetical protein [Flavobacterium collinsii]
MSPTLRSKPPKRCAFHDKKQIKSLKFKNETIEFKKASKEQISFSKNDIVSHQTNSGFAKYPYIYCSNQINSIMLSLQEKEKIKEEELFRVQVRGALQEQVTPRTVSSVTVYTFFNSAFGIWLLSTVFVGLFTWAYTEYTTHTKARLLLIQNHEKIAQEIDYRAESLSFMFKDDKLVYNYDSGHLKCLLSAAINGSDCIVDNVVQRGYLHIEYKDYNVDQLFYQLNDMEKSNPALAGRLTDMRQKYTQAFYRVQEQIHKFYIDSTKTK